MFSRYRCEVLVFLAFILWGLMPLYFRQLSGYGAHLIFAVRVLLSTPILILAVFRFYRKGMPVPSRQQTLWALAGSLFISVSWYLNLWGTINGQLLAVSLAFFLGPIFTVFAAMVIFGEKLSNKQWVTFIICIFAVVGYSISTGELPWLTLVIAISFAGYGIIKRKGGISEFNGAAAEIALMLPVAAYILFNDRHAINFSWPDDQMLLLSSILYYLPLILFGIGVRQVRQLLNVGLLNYVEPIAMYVLALTLFKEEVNFAKQITLFAIWTGIAISIPYDQFRSDNRRAVRPVTN